VGPLVLQVPEWRTLEWPAAAIAAGAIFATLRLGVGLFPLLGACAAIGIGWHLGASPP